MKWNFLTRFKRRRRCPMIRLVSLLGLVPMLAFAESAGLRDLADEHLTVPTDKGANPGLSVASLVCGLVASANSIDAMAEWGGSSRMPTPPRR